MARKHLTPKSRQALSPEKRSDKDIEMLDSDGDGDASSSSLHINGINQTSSLFANTTNQPAQPQQQTSNAFGSFGQTQNQSATATPGLFGNLSSNSTQSQQQQPLTSGLFGGLGGTNQPAQQQQIGTNAFGSLGPSQPQSQQPSNLGGLFSKSASTQAQQQRITPNLPGGIGGSQAQPSNPGASGIFGSSILNNDAQKHSQQQNGQQNGVPLPQNARFHTLLEKSKKRQLPGDSSTQFGDLPSLQLGLGDISSKLKSLGGKDTTAKSTRQVESRAQYLLAASGVPRGATLRDLNTFNAQIGTASAQASTPRVETDVDAYVANLRAKSAADLMTESLEEARREFEEFMEENVQINWDEQRRKIYEHFGLSKPGDESSGGIDAAGSDTFRGSFGRSTRRTQRNLASSTLSKSVLGGSVGRGSVRGTLFTDVAEQKNAAHLPLASEDPFLRTKQYQYAVKVNELNAARLQDLVYPVIEQFARVEADAGSDTPAHLIDGYRVIKEIVRENASAERPSDPGAVRQRQYAKDYLDPAESSARSSAMRRQILDGTRKFLEDSFVQQMDDLILKNPKEANLGGVPTRINKVRAYLRIRATRKDLGVDNNDLQMLDEDYCWALIFYLLRSGLVGEALKYVAENERAIKSMDRHFSQYISAYANDPERRLPREMQVRINAEYQQRSRLAPENSIDPFRMACYKIVGRCDLSRKAIDGINTTMEDWVWLLFSLAREANRVEETAGETFGLAETRALIEDIGERHFTNPGETSTAYATYFFLQLAVGSFEKAVAWLYPHNYVAAVHVAIALDFYGMLRVSDFTVSETQLLTYDTRGRPQISFGRLVGYYTRDFRLAKTESATDYLVLICLNSDLPGEQGRSQTSVCHEALKELVLETREFALLLGDIQPDGKRIKGAIDQRLTLINIKNGDDFLHTLTTQAAAVANDGGRVTDAVLLYHLAEDYDNVIAIINRTLSDSISVDIGQEPIRLQPLRPRESDNKQTNTANISLSQKSLSLTSIEDPAVLAEAMISLYNSNAMYYQKISQENRDACGVLLRIHNIKSLVSGGQWAKALDKIEGLEILPLRANSNVSVIRSTASAFNSLPSVIARNIGNLLIWTITCCGQQRKMFREREFQAKEPLAEELLVKAKDLMVFAGLIRYKLPPDVFEVLARAGQNAGA